MVSIFDNESEFNLRYEMNELDEFLRSRKISINGEKKSLLTIFDENIGLWPYSRAATDVDGYMYKLEKSFDEGDYDWEKQFYCYFQLYYNLSAFILELLKEDNTSLGDQKELDNLLITCMRTIQKSLNLNHMHIEKIEDKYIIVENEMNIFAIDDKHQDILKTFNKYIDYLHKDNVAYKRTLMRAMASYFEPRRDYYKETDSKDIVDTLFFGFNNLNIRHNNNGQVKLENDKDFIPLYDKMFKMALHIIKSEDVKQYKQDIDKYKKK